jgi:hypothetical protein
MFQKSHWAAALAVFAAPAVDAQQWEVGALAGGGFFLNKTVERSGSSATAGFRPGLAAGGWIGHNGTGRFGGEIRYLFGHSAMKVANGSGNVTFGAQSHTIHYDVLIHTNSREDRVRPYVAIGGGMRGFLGTGTERAIQPLSQFAILTRTHQWMPLLTFGGGVKFQFGSRLLARVELRDYVTAFPKDVILPAPGARLKGWLHSLTPLFGISYVFP